MVGALKCRGCIDRRTDRNKAHEMVVQAIKTQGFADLVDISPQTRTPVCGIAQHVSGIQYVGDGSAGGKNPLSSEEHTSELQSLLRLSYAVFCLKKLNN